MSRLSKLMFEVHLLGAGTEGVGEVSDTDRAIAFFVQRGEVASLGRTERAVRRVAVLVIPGMRRFFKKTGVREPAIAMGSLFVDPVGELRWTTFLFQAEVAIGVGRRRVQAEDGERSLDEYAIAAIGELVHGVEEGVFAIGLEHGVLRLGLRVQGENQETWDKEAQQSLHDEWPLRDVARGTIAGVGGTPILSAAPPVSIALWRRAYKMGGHGRR